MAQLTLGRGDLDAFLALFDSTQLTWPKSAAEVASQLLKGGRPAQALAVLDRALQSPQLPQAETWHTTRLAVLGALGRSEEAQRHRWQVICHTLSIPLLRDYLRQLEDFSDGEAEQRAFAVVEQHPVPLEALQFLVG